MRAETFRDPNFEWLDLVQPTGLVVAKSVLKNFGLVAERQTQVQSAEVAAQLRANTDGPALQDPWAFVCSILGWEVHLVAGAPDGPPIPNELIVRLPEHDTTLAPTWAVRELAPGGPPFQLLVLIEKGVDLDKRGVLSGWEATPHQRFERLLRETQIDAGLIIADRELRLVYAPRGETSGWLSFPIVDLATVAGRPLLAGLKLLLDRTRLFTDRPEARLPALLRRSRQEQASVSTALADQVLGALHELLRGLDAADPVLIRELATSRPHHLYEGLLTALMRLVFVLYAEDRDLLPSLNEPHAKDVYDNSYSLRGLYAKLVEDEALHPDTMDERRGGWGRLLALFRLVHGGHRSHFVQARGGKLFNPDAFPFVEGRRTLADRPSVLDVSDGCLLRVLEGLMTLKGEGGARERLSYRALDVEQIGSVYETVMGFTVETAKHRALAIKAGKNNRMPVFVDLEQLAASKGKDRIKFLKEEADRGQLSTNVVRALEAAKDSSELAVALDPIVDERGSPRKQLTAVGAPILQPTDERRRTGSHYTPRELTEPIVRHALEPAFERLGPGATPEQILSLKVCDPAMGSGAFLVEACRAIASKLVEAWSRNLDKRPAIPPDEDEELHARRLVAQLCLYGVDKNPLATDLAKLSLWLATLARDHEFTFLDHALRSGDSLVGLSQAQIAAAHWDASKPGLPLFRQLAKDRVAEVMKGRTEIQAAPDDVARAVQEQRHRSLEERIKEVRLIGDAVIAAFISGDKAKAREKKRAEVESWITPHGSLEPEWDKLGALAAGLKQGERPLGPFHWEIEFPEVFARENGGFDAVIGNPPFLGGKRISYEMGSNYFDYIKTMYTATSGNADYVSYFFLLAHEHLRNFGTAGLIATSSVAQGETRANALTRLLKNGSTIYRAQRRLPWPGAPANIVSVIHFKKGGRPNVLFIDGIPVGQITAYLFKSGSSEEPARLSANIDQCYQGAIVLGPGFIFGDNDPNQSLAELNRIVAADPKEMERIFWYLNGEELNSIPTLRPRRKIINFEDMTLDQAKRFPQLLSHVESSVKPFRRSQKRADLRDRWWQFAYEKKKLRALSQSTPFLFARSQVSKHHALGKVLRGTVIDAKLIAFAFDRSSRFSTYQCRAHELWLNFFGTTMGDRMGYTTEVCFEAFPAPSKIEAVNNWQKYYDFRSQVMSERVIGFTDLYNRFHDRTETAEDIQRLRELHADMDRAVLGAYGWNDLAERAEPVFLDETNEDDHTYQGRLFWPSEFRDEVLALLLALNAERHAEEVSLGIAPGMKGKARTEEDDEELENENDTV